MSIKRFFTQYFFTGDAGAACESEMVDFDGGAFFAQYLDQVADLACVADGTIGNCLPESDPRRDGSGTKPQPDPTTCKSTSNDLSWSTVFPAVAYNLWRYYNATSSIGPHYDKLKLYISSMAAGLNESGLANAKCKWGDWNPVQKTPCAITAATSFIRDLDRLADLAQALGHLVCVFFSILANGKLSCLFHFLHYKYHAWHLVD